MNKKLLLVVFSGTLALTSCSNDVYVDPIETIVYEDRFDVIGAYDDKLFFTEVNYTGYYKDEEHILGWTDKNGNVEFIQLQLDENCSAVNYVIDGELLKSYCSFTNNEGSTVLSYYEYDLVTKDIKRKNHVFNNYARIDRVVENYGSSTQVDNPMYSNYFFGIYQDETENNLFKKDVLFVDASSYSVIKTYDENNTRYKANFYASKNHLFQYDINTIDNELYVNKYNNVEDLSFTIDLTRTYNERLFSTTNVYLVSHYDTILDSETSQRTHNDILNSHKNNIDIYNHSGVLENNITVEGDLEICGDELCNVYQSGVSEKELHKYQIQRYNNTTNSFDNLLNLEVKYDGMFKYQFLGQNYLYSLSHNYDTDTKYDGFDYKLYDLETNKEIFSVASGYLEQELDLYKGGE